MVDIIFINCIATLNTQRCFAILCDGYIHCIPWMHNKSASDVAVNYILLNYHEISSYDADNKEKSSLSKFYMFNYQLH